MTVFQRILHRWRSESPAFFKFLTNLFITIGAVAFAIIALEKSYPERFSFITDKINLYIDYCMVIGAIGAVFAKMTVKNGNTGKQE